MANPFGDDPDPFAADDSNPFGSPDDPFSPAGTTAAAGGGGGGSGGGAAPANNPFADSSSDDEARPTPPATTTTAAAPTATTATATATATGTGTGGGAKAAAPVAAPASIAAPIAKTASEKASTAASSAKSTASSAAASGGDNLKASDLRAKEDALRRRAGELEDRETNIAALEAKFLGRKPNWPVCYPLIHHDINGDIPTEHQWTIRLLYYLWYASTFGYWFNFVVVVWAVSTIEPNQGFQAWILALTYALFIPVANFFFWYRMAYNAVRYMTNSYFVAFFVSMGLCILLWLTLAVGVLDIGCGGIITGTTLFGTYNDDAGGILSIVVLLGFIGMSVWAGVLIRNLYQVWRADGAVAAAGGGSGGGGAGAGGASDDPNVVKV